ncbi:hypothetical protein CNMCM6805_010005 [Aspergillus fumigatiaffinis]|uniref:NACHT domain-containing protein n=1 Tax=Aspergillus fumigatiaffinis TaxID=340414 RepID=A0A8H4H0Q9_9EURO|nr:hypothetical protein CNMCM6805_010005 [Aspergillus fumigatiaffinis]
MDGLSSAASVIAVVQIAGSIVKLCGGYIQEVKDARDNIFSLQWSIEGIQGTLLDLQKSLRWDGGMALPTSSKLANNITDCLSYLRDLEAKLNPGKGKKLMRKVGLRALKWPLKRAENAGRINQNLDLAKLEGAIDAGFESFSDRNEAQCLQGTRAELLRKIMDWAVSPSQEKCIFWLNGMAGTGKSTISRTAAKKLKDTNHLGASFFFKRGEGDRGNAKKFFPTLTRQLIFRISGLRAGVQKAFDKDPEITTKSLKEQFEQLLLQPLLSLDQPDLHPSTAVIVIDALDECDHDQDIRTIIRLLPLLQRAKAIRLRIFLTSRPELPISLSFSEIADHEYQELALHEISEEVTKRDIRLFLQDRFAKIKHDKNISEDWPGNDAIQALVTMSVPLFVSAATVCRYIENSRLEPKSRLSELLVNQSKYVSRMDKTYLPILTRLLDDQESDESEQQQLLQEFQEVMGIIILLAVPLSINTLSLFLGIGADRIGHLLDLFRLVLSIPCDRDQPVRILHLSFRDFLVQSGGKFHVDEPKTHKEIARSCVETVRSRLHRDICHLVSPGTQRADIESQYIHYYIPPELQYSCRYWVHHLEKSQISSSEAEDVQQFLQKHFLHWLEAMGLLGLASEMVGILDLLLTVIPRFVLKNRRIADEAPLQIYCSGLVFAPRTAIIRRAFQSERPSWIRQFPQVDEGWSAELQALEGHSDGVTSVAFSPDSLLLASASRDMTIQLWNPSIGTLQRTLEGHSTSVQSVALSPDGRLLASASEDKTVWMWDLATGALLQTLEGHSDWVWLVAFSPTGGLLASASADKTIWMWDLSTGALLHTLEGYSDWVHSVAFSPDSRLLASASRDKTIRLWDPSTCALQQNLKGHSASVRSVAFSLDGRLLASASDDKTIRMWDPSTGALLQTLEGHSDWVWSVAFSPAGGLLASASRDRTVRLWDTATGVLQQSLEGYSDFIQSVAFAPNNRLLASASDDKTIRLWNPSIGALQQTLEGHSASVQLMTFSPDSRILASASDDKTIRLWVPSTGALLQTLEGHSIWVQSVAFSPDGRLLASTSYDKTVRLWDPSTGALLQTLEGHSVRVRSIAFSPNSRLLASTSDDRTIRLWDPTTGALQQTLEGHSD